MAVTNRTIGANVSRGGFFKAVRQSDGRPDITYTSDEMREPYRGLISDGIIATKGDQNNKADHTNFKVYADGSGSGARRVRVSSGRGIFDGHWFKTTEDVIFEADPEGTLDCRIDSVVISVNNNNRVINLVYRRGDSATNAPALVNSGGIVEYRIANFKVWKNAYVVNDGDIIDKRGLNHPEGTPWVATVVNQLSTEDIFKKWEALFDDYFHQMDQQVKEWGAAAVEGSNYQALTTTQVVRTLEGRANTITLNETTDYEAYNPSTSYYLPMVTVNGYLLTRKKVNTPSSPGDYFMDPSEAHKLIFRFDEYLNAGSVVTIVLLRAITAANVPSLTGQIEALNEIVDLYTRDNGWERLDASCLATGASIADDPLGNQHYLEPDAQLAVRRIGHTVYLRGLVKGVNPVVGNLIATIPETGEISGDIRPDCNHIFASNSKQVTETDGVITITTPDRAEIVVEPNGQIKFWVTSRSSGATQNTAAYWALNTSWPIPVSSLNYPQEVNGNG